MGDIPDIRKDLPMSMTMSAFAGISWYIGAEINTSLFLLFKRRRGLYFWACALGSWGVVLQPLFIILADFGVWTNLRGSITLIYLTWAVMVVPQSWVLYSRLHLIMHGETALRWIKFVLLFTSVAFTVPTIVIGLLAQATDFNPNLFHINTIWDRLQLIVFFVQETALSVLYIWQARKYLRDSSLLHKPYSTTTTTTTTTTEATSLSLSSAARSDTNEVLRHLIYTNVLIIALDAALLGIQSAGLFYLQGAFKPCVYGVKLKAEFAILNRLIRSIRGDRSSADSGGSGFYNDNTNNNSNNPYDPALAGSGQQLQLQLQPQPHQHQQQQQQQSARSRTGGGAPLWPRRPRMRSQGTGGSGGVGGGGEDGDGVWLGQLDRPNRGSRSRSHESQSPILGKADDGHGVLGMPSRDPRAGRT